MSIRSFRRQIRKQRQSAMRHGKRTIIRTDPTLGPAIFRFFAHGYEWAAKKKRAQIHRQIAYAREHGEVTG